MKSQLESGDFVSDEVANTLVGKYISQKKASKGFILDGYPATAKQAEYLEATLEQMGLPDPMVVHLQVPDAVAVDRMNSQRPCR